MRRKPSQICARLAPLIVACWMVTPGLLQAEGGASGVMMVVKGSVQIQSAKEKKLIAAKIGAKVFAQDVIITGPDSRAKIVMSDKNEINVSPDTRLELEKYVYNPQKNEKNVLLNVVYGKVRSQVNQKYDADKNTFRVKTPSAVAGVRGTDFLASFDPGPKVSKVVTFSGVVEVGKPGAGGAILNPVRVSPGQFTTATPGSAPSAPSPVPKAELNQLNQQTKAETAKGSETSSAGGGAHADGEQKKEQGKEQNKDGDQSKDQGKTEQKDNAKDSTKDSAKDKRSPASLSPAGADTASSGDSSKGSGTKGASLAAGGSFGTAMPSMMDSRDLGPAALTGVAAPPDFSNHGGNLVVIAPVTRPTDVLPPRCDFCNSVLTGTKTRLNIQINIQ